MKYDRPGEKRRVDVVLGELKDPMPSNPYIRPDVAGARRVHLRFRREPANPALRG